jgi:hypothetical protein
MATSIMAGNQKKNSIHQRGKRIMRRFSPSTVITSNNELGGSSPESSSSSSTNGTTTTTTTSTVLKKTNKKEEEEGKLSSSWSSSSLSSSSSIGTARTSNTTVRFNSKCYVKRTISRYDYTTEEIENCWYKKHELDTIWSNCIEDIQKANSRNNNTINNDQHEYQQHDDDDDDDSCIRGLDRCTVPSLFSKRENRQKAKNAVFMEQYNHTLWCGGGGGGGGDTSSPEESIANKYYEISCKCQLLATDIGLQDQRNVYDIMI